MSELFGQSADSNQFDIDFSVPLVHRLRFTQDCFGKDFHVLGKLLEPGITRDARVQVWVDEGLANWDPTLCARITHCLRSAAKIDLVAEVEVLPGGEVIKNDPSYVDALLTAFNRDNLDRRSYVLVVGGGAVLDTVGYAASIAHRGIRLIRVPTTTLAQADSGVGVKNAVNWFAKKNWKGTFATPWGVVNDEHLLTGLSDRDYRCGFSEAVKVAMLKDAEFFEFLVHAAADISARQRAPASRAIRQSVLLHLHHITRGGDPFELQQARPLDFGHWSAHKLEAITDYRLRHGEAVAIGVAVDVAYSHLKYGLDLATVQATFALFQGLQLPIWDSALNEEVIFDGLEEFRQHLGGELTVTMLQQLAQPVDVHSIDHRVMREAMNMVATSAQQQVTAAK
ncbi:3-dehydroquinate synthase [Aureliella helgolandensis]|uniref:3-dehydroquinate synthase n=1 Tax=Aureliella helgolandensis TaxID=2527968 RepID=A0A518G0P4_9BACT|nr:3-dehydroquinate synthase [Aureliella helgolandensis]QDV22146.1 3-dehydroquinate synthase [Aureliella helgolandensis]